MSDTAAGKGAETSARGPQIDDMIEPAADGSAFEAYRAHTRYIASADLVDPADLPRFHARIRVYMFADSVFSDVELSHPQHLVRSPYDIARSGLDHLLVYFHAVGQFDGSCGERPFHPRKGDVSFVDLGQTFAFTVSAARVVGLMVPRSSLPAAVQGRRLHGYVPPRAAPATQLVARFMRHLTAAASTLPHDELAAALHAVLPLADAATLHCQSRESVSMPKTDLALFDRVRVYIERHLSERDLDAEEVAKAGKVSRKRLYELFTPYGGVGAYVRERRLQSAYEAINDEVRGEETLGVIAHSLGFGSEVVFSRSFRERFGLSPSELRVIARARGVAVPVPRIPEMSPRSIATLGC